MAQISITFVSKRDGVVTNSVDLPEDTVTRITDAMINTYRTMYDHMGNTLEMEPTPENGLLELSNNLITHMINTTAEAELEQLRKKMMDEHNFIQVPELPYARRTQISPIPPTEIPIS